MQRLVPGDNMITLHYDASDLVPLTCLADVKAPQLYDKHLFIQLCVYKKKGILAENIGQCAVPLRECVTKSHGETIQYVRVSPNNPDMPHVPLVSRSNDAWLALQIHVGPDQILDQEGDGARRGCIVAAGCIGRRVSTRLIGHACTAASSLACAAGIKGRGKGSFMSSPLLQLRVEINCK
jgi:hypothetical protein